MENYYANGKLLLTGEYLILDGAIGLALPTKLGQSLTVKDNYVSNLEWKSLDHENKIWFQHNYQNLNNPVEKPIAERLRNILLEAQKINPYFLKNLNQDITTKLEFPKDWGLGTSSTLIYLIAQWAKIDPFDLLFKTFGGSGYDIACAEIGSPLFYALQEKKPFFQKITFNPPFQKNLYFVYLDKKQNSRSGIQHYRKKSNGIQKEIEEITTISYMIQQARNLQIFEALLMQHETIIASIIQLPTVQHLYFSDYWGSVKSLGAWGGDFVLATSNQPYEKTKKYFNEKGFEVFLKYEELIL